MPPTPILALIAWGALVAYAILRPADDDDGD